MNQVKLFEAHSRQEIEHEINNWLYVNAELNKKIKILTIKLYTLNDNQVIVYTVLIHYKLLK